MNHSPRHDILRAAIALFLSMAVVTFAQYQVNNRVGGASNQVNNRVGGELYGNNTNMGTVRYASQSQTVLLPSEVRNATVRSGALPSEIRMNAAASGPLPVNGAIAYVPTQSPVQAAYKMPAQNYTPNNYNFTRASADQSLAPQAGFAASNSIHYSAPPPPAPPPSMSTGQTAAKTVPIGTSPPAPPPSMETPSLKSSYNNSGSIHFATLANP